MPTYIPRPAARQYLEQVHGLILGETALENMASDGTGPTYVVIAKRALYTREALDAWVVEQAARPVVRRRAHREQTAA